MTRPLGVSRMVDEHAWQRPGAGRAADFDATRLFLDQPPPPGRRGVTEGGIGTRVDQRTDKPALDRDRRMPERVDASVNHVQLAGSAPATGGGLADTAGSELPRADHSPLTARQLRREK